MYKCITVCCSMLLCVSVLCIKLQCVFACLCFHSLARSRAICILYKNSTCAVQGVVVCCSVLQCVFTPLHHLLTHLLARTRAFSLAGLLFIVRNTDAGQRLSNIREELKSEVRELIPALQALEMDHGLRVRLEKRQVCFGVSMGGGRGEGVHTLTDRLFTRTHTCTHTILLLRSRSRSPHTFTL